MYLNRHVKILVINFFLVINLLLFFFSFIKYSGNSLIFILLFLINNFYIFYSFKYSHLFLDKTLSIFLWLGYFYKLCVILIYNTTFPEGGGNFDYSNKDYDKLLIFSSIGISSFILGSILINNKIKIESYTNGLTNTKFLKFYKNYRNTILILFLFLIIFVGSVNFVNGFYQKGLLPKNEFNILLGSFLKWMLIFGLTSISCLIIEYDIKIYKKIGLLVLFIFYFELVITNTSMLSRSMIFSGSAVLFSIYYNYEKKIIKNLTSSLVLNFVILFIIFFLLLFPINKIRQYLFVDVKYQTDEKVNLIITNKIKNNEFNKVLESKKTKEEKIEIIKRKVEEQKKEIQKLDFKENLERIIFVIKNRFVGLDGMAAVSSYPNKNFVLLFEGLKEEVNFSKYGFYQRIFVIPFVAGELNDEYEKSSERHYGIIIPGILSFLSYPGSMFFLTISTLIIYFLCSLIEIFSRKFTNNSIIFSNYIGYVLGYRLIHFGYLPKQTYLIISAIFLTIFLIYVTQNIINKFEDE